MNNAQTITIVAICASLWAALLAYIYRPQIQSWRYRRAYDRVARELAGERFAEVDADIDRQSVRRASKRGKTNVVLGGRVTRDRVRLTAEQIRAIHEREQWGADHDQAGEALGGLD